MTAPAHRRPRFSTGGVLLLVLLLLPCLASASLTVKPAFVEFDLSRGRPSDIITVTNVTDQDLRFRAKTEHFRYLPGGGFETVEPDENSMASWVKFNPREFDLAAGESRVIRLTVMTPKNLDDGEYWAALNFEPLKGLISESESTDGKSVAIEVRASILVPLVGSKGDLVYQCDLTDLKAWRCDGGVSMTASLSNTGTGRARVSGTYQILDSDETPLAEGLLGTDTILAGGDRNFAQMVTGEFPPGEVSVRVRYTSPKFKDTLAGQTKVRKDAPPGLEGATR